MEDEIIAAKRHVRSRSQLNSYYKSQRTMQRLETFTITFKVEGFSGDFHYFYNPLARTFMVLTPGGYEAVVCPHNERCEGSAGGHVCPHLKSEMERVKDAMDGLDMREKGMSKPGQVDATGIKRIIDKIILDRGLESLEKEGALEALCSSVSSNYYYDEELSVLVIVAAPWATSLYITDLNLNYEAYTCSNPRCHVPAVKKDGMNWVCKDCQLPEYGLDDDKMTFGNVFGRAWKYATGDDEIIDMTMEKYVRTMQELYKLGPYGFGYKNVIAYIGMHIQEDGNKGPVYIRRVYKRMPAKPNSNAIHSKCLQHGCNDSTASRKIGPDHHRLTYCWRHKERPNVKVDIFQGLKYGENEITADLVHWRRGSAFASLKKTFSQTNIDQLTRAASALSINIGAEPVQRARCNTFPGAFPRVKKEEKKN